MVDAAQAQYRDEFILGFEDRSSRLRSTTVTEADVRGNTAIFLVADSGDATAVTRGVNGMIPARTDSNTQLTATLQEWHDLARKNQFNIMSSQGDQRALMQQTTMDVMNRKIDDDIITQMDTATLTTGTATTASIDMVVHAKTVLGNNFVDITDEDNLFACISPAFEGYLMQTSEYSSADYVTNSPWSGPARSYKRWAGVNWIVHPRLTGSVGAGGAGSSESCFMYHRNAIGHAVHMDGIESVIGFDDEQGYSFARCTSHMGSKLLQNTGVVKMLHDGSNYVAV